MAFYELVSGKLEVSYANNDQCSSICDANCDRTGVAPGVVLWSRGRGILFGVREKIRVGNIAFLQVRGWQS